MALRDLALFRPSLYFINCGRSVCPRNLIFAGESQERTMEIVWGFYLLHMDGRNILIDCGFQDQALAAKFGITLCDPFPALAGLGIELRQVNDIIITHHHFDHTGNIPRFPRAKVIIQREEYELYRKELPDHPPVASTQLRRFDDECELDEMLQLRRIGGHTSGSTEVSFLYHGRRYIIPGDECYVADNWRQRIPIGFADHPEVNRQYVEALPADAVVLTLHDPELLKNYPSAGDNAVQILPE